MHRALLALCLMLAAGLVPGSRSVAQETGCTLPPNPGGAITFGLVPPEYDVGTDMGWGVEFDQPSESGYASEPVYELDGPGGPQTVTLPFHVPAEGTYTVTAHWTESCGDDVTPDRAVTSRPGTFKGVGPQPPSGGGELRQGRGRPPGGRRPPAGGRGGARGGTAARRLPEQPRRRAAAGGRSHHRPHHHEHPSP